MSLLANILYLVSATCLLSGLFIQAKSPTSVMLEAPIKLNQKIGFDIQENIYGNNENLIRLKILPDREAIGDAEMKILVDADFSVFEKVMFRIIDPNGKIEEVIF